ncbi:MAG: DUF2480 family protein [Chitinophagales bacterium]|nr:DUF2480 family protein [Chitinophagales bacterium]MCB9020104.1 DUF2480 family protein [Chitinophagales bacterium]MCB9021527.1 DUF2480 family protein [Chitinophagales bacterium]HPE98604.1 DUF2480 family protein [Chitinophagales bacterium]HPR30309.1 DUF2480 family protein [Chitinophagales bacterium]
MEIVNKVAQSGLLTIDLEAYFPADKVCGFDLKSFLFRELILKEKDFREAMAAIDWSAYSGKILAIHCTADAIIPQWAYMLVTVYAAPYAEKIYLADPDQALHKYYEEIVHDFDTTPYEGQRIVVKGCSKHPVPADAYVALTRKLRPVAKSIMYGEPCSTVPLFKRRES